MFLYNCINEKMLCFKLISLFYSNLSITGLWKQKVVAYCRMLHSVNRSALFDISLLMVNPNDEISSVSRISLGYEISVFVHNRSFIRSKLL